jgi:hypothetical protein
MIQKGHKGVWGTSILYFLKSIGLTRIMIYVGKTDKFILFAKCLKLYRFWSLCIHNQCGISKKLNFMLIQNSLKNGLKNSSRKKIPHWQNLCKFWVLRSFVRFSYISCLFIFCNIFWAHFNEFGISINFCVFCISHWFIIEIIFWRFY